MLSSTLEDTAPIMDLSQDPVNAQVVSDVSFAVPTQIFPPTNAPSQFWNAGKIVSAVCHGTAYVISCKIFRPMTNYFSSALVGGVDTAGKSILSGRNVTGFSNAEEIAIDGVKVRNNY